MKAKLLDLCDIRIGRTPPRKQPQWFSRHYGNKWVSIKDMGLSNKYLFNTTECLTNDAVEKFNVPKIERGTIILSFKLTVGRIAIVSEDMYSNEAIAQLPIRRSAASFVDRDYLYYKLKYYDFNKLGSTSSIATAINSKMLANMEIDLPDFATQKKIAGTLSAFDDKIELNRQMNETLEEMGRALFRHYFIDNSEAKNWPKRRLGEFFDVVTGKKDANYATSDGKYPFFTCAQTISRAPTYSFDGDAILLAGNGDFNVKIYSGKFEAYQRTYVLIPYKSKLIGFLYYLMNVQLQDITGGSQGSVIRFITKGMIDGYSFALPDDDRLLALSGVFNNIVELSEYNNNENCVLVNIRDSIARKLVGR